MRVPFRQPGKYALIKPDRHITQIKFDKLEAQLAKLLVTRQTAIDEVQKYAFEGDFSENAPYQIAKGRLRGINQKILEIEDALSHAEIIKTSGQKHTVQLGCSVTIKINNETKTYQILGSAETNPQAGIISFRSPFGEALMGHKINDIITLQIGKKEVTCQIVKIV